MNYYNSNEAESSQYNKELYIGESMNMYGKLKTTVNQINDTAEITQSLQIYEKQIPVEPAFVKIYFRDICLLNNVPKGMACFLHAIIPLMNYKNQIYINNKLKVEISQQLGLTKHTFDAAIKVFVKQKLLIRESPGYFMFNPQIFGRGSWNDIYQMREKIKIAIEYNESDHIITTERICENA